MSARRIACMALAIVGAFAACATQVDSGTQSGKNDATQPKLSWKAYPNQRDLEKDIQGKLKSVQSVTYELVIYSADRRIVYSRQFLSAPEHRLEMQLPPGQIFYWTVRPHFKIDGKHRVGRWSASSSTQLQLPTPLSHYRSFRT